MWCQGNEVYLENEIGITENRKRRQNYTKSASFLIVIDGSNDLTFFTISSPLGFLFLCKKRFHSTNSKGFGDITVVVEKAISRCLEIFDRGQVVFGRGNLSGKSS